ncbi:hypothetical protein PMAYCL1PPCAC_06654, partial [Pristionchus mayeri]
AMASDTKWSDVDVDKVNALLQWIHSLSFEGSVDVDIEKLRSGAPFGRILKMVDDQFFGIDWIAEVTKYNEDANWRLKENNLRKVYKRLGEYIHDCIGDCDFDQWNIDFEQSAREDLRGILRLLQLTVVVAFKGPNNAVFVTNIGRLSPQIQMAIKHALDEFELCTREESQSPKPLPTRDEHRRVSINHNLLYEDDDVVKSMSEEVEAMKSKLEEKDGVIKKMERKLSELQERKAEEIKEMRQKLSEREMAFTELEYEKSMLSEESKRLKEEMGDLRARLSETSRVEEDRFRREKSDLTDEIVHLKEKNEQLENRVRDCKEHMNQLKVEEQKNNAYRAQLIELDNGKETVKNLKQNIGSLQLTIEENHRDMDTLKAERDQAVADRVELREKMSVMEEEKRQLTINLSKVTFQFHNGAGLDRKPSLVEELASVTGDSHHEEELKKELAIMKERNRDLEEEVEKRRGAEEEVKILMNKCAEMTNSAVKVKMDQKEMEEKDLRIRELTVTLERMKVQHEQETRLMTSAVYEMGRQRLSGGLSEREAVTDRSGTSSSRSFFRRQNQENAFNLSVLAWLVVGVVVMGVLFAQPLSDALSHFTNRRQIPLYV